MRVSDRIKELRKEKGYTQKQLAKEVKVSQSAVSLWEKGRTLPDTKTLKALANLFSCTTDELLGCNVIDNTISQIQAVCSQLNSNGQEKVIDYAKDLLKIREYKKGYTKTEQ